MASNSLIQMLTQSHVFMKQGQRHGALDKQGCVSYDGCTRQVLCMIDDLMVARQKSVMFFYSAICL